MSTMFVGCNTNSGIDIQNKEQVTLEQDSSVQNQSEVSKFQTFVFNDAESDVVIEYNLYLHRMAKDKGNGYKVNIEKIIIYC